MNITFASAETLDNVLAVVVTDGTLSAPAVALDDASGGALTRELGRGRIRPGKGDAAVVTGGNTGPERVLLIGVGTQKEGRAEALRSLGGRIAATVRALRADTVTILAPELDDEGADAVADLAGLVEGLALAHYRYDRFRSSDDAAGGEGNLHYPGSVTITGASESARAAAERAQIVARATNWARDLANTPPNYMTPELLAGEAETMASHHEHLSVTVLDGAAITAAGMGMLAAVGQGSPNEPRLIVLEWNPPGDTTPDDERLALVGKAVTFDTGGISIKSSAGMAEMKLDKAGGCAVLGGMCAIAELNIPRRVLAVVGAAENMPDGAAYKPGDVITAMDGTTVEITNTDAEGRLVLGDAISYARQLGCGRIVEASTLTGAMVVALGHHFTGAIARSSELTDAVLASAARTGDHAWHLPMHDSYKTNLKSDCADLQNSGSRAGGALYAGLFLEHFAKDTPFVHLDVAGTAMLPKPQRYFAAKGASGWGVRLFADLAATH